MWRHRVHSIFYWSNWHPNPLNKGFVHFDFKSPFDVVVRNGPQSYRLQWQGQVKSAMLPRVVYQPPLHMIFENNQALGGPGLLEKEPAKCWNQGAFSWLNSCWLTRCLAAGFSLFIACFQYVVTGAHVRRWCLQWGLAMSVGAEYWVFHRKTAVQEITHDRGNVHTNSSALLTPALLLLWGLDHSVGGWLAALAWLELAGDSETQALPQT